MSSLKPIFVSSIEGNHQLLDGGAMFGHTPRPLWERWAKPDALGRIRLACRALLIEREGKRLLCETGIGAYMEPTLAQRFGVEESDHQLLIHLKALGLKHEDIDYVILSHLHFDHAGGLLPTYAEIQAGQRNLLFPKAHYVVGREAWERAKQPHVRDRASFIPGMTQQLEASGRLLVIDTPELPGIPKEQVWFRFSSGHTPGHMHTVVRGVRETMLFAGDLIPGRTWVHLPITMGYDRFPEQLIDEKAELYKDAVPGSWKIFFTHDTDCAAAQVQKDEKDRYVTTNEVSRLERYAL
jgi:glyoxylase-like metal-dependent hydrolase (beta-lactamase superfamily II)